MSCTSQLCLLFCVQPIKKSPLHILFCYSSSSESSSREGEKRLSKQQANSFILGVRAWKVQSGSSGQKGMILPETKTCCGSEVGGKEGGWAAKSYWGRGASNSICHLPNASHLSKQTVSEQVCMLKAGIKLLHIHAALEQTCTKQCPPTE